MMMALGSLQFDVKVNAQSVTSNAEASFASHAVIGVAPVKELTGQGDHTVEIQGEVHPYHFGGLAGLKKLDIMRQRGLPVPYMSGALIPFGWVIINSLSEAHTEIGPGGVGQVIKFTTKVTKVDRPSISLGATIMRFLI